MKYYVFITPDNVIWGTGNTKKETIKDAKVCIRDWYRCNRDEDTPDLGKVVPATKKLVDKVANNGFYDDMFELVDTPTGWLADIKNPNPPNYYVMLRDIKETKIKL